MKILYDYQALSMQRFGGISRYFYELATRLGAKEGVEVDVATRFNSNYYFEDYFKGKSAGLPWKFSKFNNVLNRMAVKHRDKKAYDIIHPTYYHPYILNRFKGKLVVTIHDMIYELMPDKLPDAQTIIERKKAHIFAADKIICVSEHTKKDMLAIYPEIPEDRAVVIYHGNSMPVQTQKPKKCERLEKYAEYILFVGRRDSYKNFDALAAAFSEIAKDDGQLYLVCAGGGEFSGSEKQNLESLGIADRCVRLDFSDSELISAYSNAQCFVFPSLYEGLGLPILESWACGCPLVLSDASCFPEIAGDAGEFFDGEDVKSIKSALQKVIYNEKLKAELKEKGAERLKLFDWDITAEKTLETYKSLF